jgi:hypothetical protein
VQAFGKCQKRLLAVRGVLIARVTTGRIISQVSA